MLKTTFPTKFLFTFFFLFLGLLVGNVATAQVVITKPNLTIPVCSGFPTAYNILGNIVIDENNGSDSGIGNGTNRTIILTAPSYFEFNPGVGSIAFNAGQDISSASISVTATTITITYTTDGTANRDNDRLIISGIEVRAINSASTGNITRTGGDAVINGLETGGLLTNTLVSNTGCTYCSPTYTNGPGTIDRITNVTLGTLNNTTAGSVSPYYTFYNTVTIPNLTPSTTASVSVTYSSDSNQYAGVWIDFNQDGIFQISEGVVSTVNAGANGTSTINIAIPAGALTGNTRMRVRGGDDTALTTGQSCGNSNSSWGETEDYIVNIVASTPPTITGLGATSGCAGGSITINGTNLTGATAAGVTIGGTAVSSITSNSGTVLIAVIGAGTTGTVSVTTPAGTATIAGFTVNTAPAQPSVIIGSTTPCSGTSQTYSVTNVSGVTYTWSFPAGWSQTSGGTSNSITVTTNGTSGTVSVTPSNTCGNGTIRTLAVIPTTVPAQPSAITGVTAACTLSTQVYSVTNVPGTTYTWTLPLGWTKTAGGTTNSITVTAGLTGGTITVTPSNACGNGTAQTLAVSTIAAAPSQPSTITGNTTPCATTSQTYSVTNVAGTTYTWGFPAGWVQTAGGTTNSITVTASTSTGNITVTPSNSCGDGTARTLAVTPTAVPAQPSTITGNNNICSNSSQSYSVTNVAGVTYNWSFPAGWVQTAGTTTSAVTVTTNGTSGTVTVTPSNACGNGTARTLSVTTNTPTVSAGAVLTAICQGGTSAALGGSYAGGVTGAVWSDGGIGGTFTNNDGTTPGTTTWKPPVAYTGTATLTLTSVGGSCGTTNASKNQVVNAGSFATVGSAQKIYAAFTSTSLGGNAPGGTTGAWTKISGPGTVNFSSTTSATATATVSSYGAYVLRWTLTSSCGTTTADITVTYEPFKDPEYTISYENFDNSNGGWASSTTSGTAWTYTNTATSAHRGEGSFWSVNNYANSSLTYLTSPSIVTTGYTNVKLFLDIRYDTDNDRDDGMQIQYSTDNGATWAVLGTNTATWYSANNVTSFAGTLGWNDNNTTIAAPFSQFEERSIQLASLNNLPNLKLRAVFDSDGSNTDTGVAIDNIIIKGDPIVPFANPVTGPGSINSDLKLWLKSNTGTSTTTDGSALSIWNDQAYNNNSVGINGNSPIYRNNATRNINYNPVVDFDASALQVMKGKGGYWSQDYYVVIKTNGLINNSTATRQVPISGRMATNGFQVDGTALGLGDFTARYNNEMVSHNINSIPTAPPTDTKSYGRAYTSSTDSYNQETIIFNVKTNSSGTATEIYKNGKRIDNTTGQTVGSDQTTFTGTMNFSEFSNIQYNLGVGRFTLAGNAGSYLNGRMTEVVSYSNPKSVIEQQKIQSYLAIKNGITLHATNSATANDLCDVNYIDSNGAIIWNTTNNSGYNFDIAGIGRDDNTLLNQKQSKTENPTTDISIGLGDLLDVNTNNPNTFDTDKKFLVWGNNHGTLAAQPAVIVNISSGITSPSTLVSDVSFISVGRTWKVVETGGNIPTTKVSIPTTMLSATLTPPGDYLMFISNTPNFDPTAEYRVMKANGANLETTYDFDGTKYITFGFAPEKTFVRCIKFDGTDDYLDAGKVLNLNTSFTVSAWVNRNSTNKTILSKRNSTFSEGYDLSINSFGRAEMSWMVGSTKHTITSNTVIPSGIWHHIGVIYDGTTAKMYIDGVTTVSASMPNVPSTTQSFLIAAADGVNPTALFNGSIDEVRVWDVALSEAQFRYVINQEIQKNGTLTNGSTIPGTITLNDISSIQWNKLSAYYPMSTYTYTNAKDISDNNFTAALRNLTTVDRQTAPLPYESAADGLWQTIGTWTNSSLQDLPYEKSIEDATKYIDWNIVKTTHNITSQGDKTVLGLYVGVVTGSKLTATTTSGSQTDGSKIQVTHYLKLDGTIDLIGRSQLVQTEGSDLDKSSAGSIKRDQQGQANKFNYNYWSSPVGPINNASNNNPYTVDSILRDGTNPASPGPITWIGGYDGALSPFSLARYWIYKFDNLGNAYANWTAINETGSLDPGKGFTLKGAGVSGTQNLTFIGKPNNGTISNTVGSKQLLLTGNPYASAIDAIQFINDNSTSITGTLYFWEHYQTNNSHNLAEYQGGYAVKNLSASVAPSSVGVLSISGNGSSLKNAPNQYIPVGQGFFVVGKDNGVGVQSSVTFRNSQRAFVKEDNPTGSQSLYRIPAKPKESAHWTSSSEESVEKDAYKRIRLGFNNYNQIFHRQVVLAFMEDKADSEFNDGYDAKNIDNVVNDMYLVNGTNKLIIEGEGYFNKEASYPIGVKNNTEGTVSFIIDGLENFDDNQVVFLYDDETKTYHDIRTEPYEVVLPRGENKTRFSLRFTDKTLGIGEEVISSHAIKVFYAQNSKVLTINNTILDVPVEKVTLYNIIGQSTGTWKVENQDQQNIQLPIKGVSAGVYIAKIKTSNGVVNKKIIIP
nr:LamG-like jellyroll fold domain-containing protein [uncultured Flavobacterium sp.]